MKLTKILALFLIINFGFLGCEVDQSIQIRIKNEYPEAFNNVKFGSIEFGTIESGAQTEYHKVNSLYFKVSGETDTGDQLSGSISLPQYRDKKYTIIIKESGELDRTVDG